MCFIIAGLQPRTRTLEETPRRCPQCGLHQAVMRRVDHYLSLFFLPLLRVKKGEPFLYCQRCELPVGSGSGPSKDPRPRKGEPPRMCTQCGRTLEKKFAFCPYCGQHQ